MDSSIPHQKSLDLLRKSVTPHGFLASITAVSNYQRIWARDGVICGLASLLTGDEKLIECFRQNLETLRDHQGPQGQIPSNVYHDENGETSLSFGGLCGRVDTITWYVIGVCNFAKLTGDMKLAEKHRQSLRKALNLLDAWEFNGRGLVYVPQSGNWADEYILHGYILYDQLLRLWALRCFGDLFQDNEIQEKAKELTEIIEINYWPLKENLNHQKVYHFNAFKQYIDYNDHPDHWLCCLNPGGYSEKFDPLANALAILLNLGNTEMCKTIFEYTQDIVSIIKLKMVPAFWPPIYSGDKGWDELRTNNKYEFRNLPNEFQNGGIWPCFNGFWGIALQKAGKIEVAKNLLKQIHVANKIDEDEEGEWGFFENIHAKRLKPLGTRHCTWSAAGAIILHECLGGKRLYFG